jgi:hypothetical protein
MHLVSTHLKRETDRHKPQDYLKSVAGSSFIALLRKMSRSRVNNILYNNAQGFPSNKYI